MNGQVGSRRSKVEMSLTRADHFVEQRVGLHRDHESSTSVANTSIMR